MGNTLTFPYFWKGLGAGFGPSPLGRGGVTLNKTVHVVAVA